MLSKVPLNVLFPHYTLCNNNRKSVTSNIPIWLCPFKEVVQYHLGIVDRWFHKLDYGHIQVFQQLLINGFWEQAVEILSMREIDQVLLGCSW